MKKVLVGLSLSVMIAGAYADVNYRTEDNWFVSGESQKHLKGEKERRLV